MNCRQFLSLALALSIVLWAAQEPKAWSGPPPASPAASAPPGGADASELDLRIVEVRLRKRQILAPDMFAWETPDGQLYLPLVTLSDALGFRIREDTPGKSSGWFLKEAQTIDIDLAARAARIGNKQVDLLPNHARLIDSTLHVSLNALNDWFVLNGAWLPDGQQLFLEPAYLLASEEIERRRSQSAAGPPPDIETAGFVHTHSDYGWLSWPIVTANLSATTSKASRANESATGNSGGGGNSFAGSFLAQGDFLKTTARLAASISRDADPSVRLTLGRQDMAGGLLGPMRATHVEAGDVVAEGNTLQQSPLGGVGVRVARTSAETTAEFDRIDLIGDAPPGWQAELYREMELLGFQSIPPTGRYEFLDTPLVFGVNRFRIELFGPSGERRRLERKFDVASSLIRPGEVRYALTAVRQGESLFGDLEGPANGGGGTARPGSDLIQAQGGVGLTRNLSISSIVSWQRQEGGETTTSAGAGLGVRTGPVFWQGDALWQPERGNAQRVSALTGLGPATFTASHEWRSEKFLDVGQTFDLPPLRQQTSLSLDGRWKGFGANLGGTAAYRWNGSRDLGASLRLNGNLAGLSATHSLAYRQTVYGVRSEQRTSHALAVAGTVASIRVRTAYEAEISPEYSPRQVRLDASTQYGPWYVSAGIARHFERESTDWRAGLSRDFNGIRLGFEGSYLEDSDNLALAASLSLAVDRTPDGRMRFGRDARSQRGTVLARAFRDNDGDGRFSSGDVYVDGARFETYPRARASHSEGATLVEDLPAFRPVAIQTDLSGVEDPYLIATVPGVFVNPRPGAVVSVDFPLIESGEVEIKVLGGDQSPVSGQIVALTPCGGGSPRRTRTAFDGLAFLGNLSPGCYDALVGSEPGWDALRLVVEPGKVTRATMSRPEARLAFHIPAEPPPRAESTGVRSNP